MRRPGPRYLTCFYCGKRTRSKYDVGTRDFMCTFCEATNYLDENGEITDPPVATEREAPATQFAAPTSSSIQTDSIFCAACLKNQRLFTASLAQYLPEDPSDPDYETLERNYYKYRRSLEKRYPQVCEQCAAKVDDRIRQAGFTAKTDHLRRMMERSSGRRSAARRRTPLDLAASLGKYLWWGGLVLQLLWHLKMVAGILRHTDDGLYDPDDSSIAATATTKLRMAAGYLPPGDTLIRMSILASILCVWWNPHFVQVNRGFSRHLLGFTQWYAFQGLTIFFRFVFRGVLELEGGQAQSRNAQLSAHLVMAAIMCLIYTLAGKSIKVNTTALFETENGTVSPASAQTQTPAQRKREDRMTFSDLLSDALDTPASGIADSPSIRPNQSPVTSITSSMPLYEPAQSSRSSAFHLGSMSLDDKPSRRQPVSSYSEEMDWTPTTTTHRALKDFSPKQDSRAFGQAPTNPDASQFWYKVPPAPTAPAQKLRNPRLPIVRSSPAEKQSSIFSKKKSGKSSHGKEEDEEDDRAIDFKQPSFFAPEDENDDANSLADLLGKSFSLSQERDQSQRPRNKSARWTVMHKKTTDRTETWYISDPGAVFTVLLFILWTIMTKVSVVYSTEAKLVTLSLAGFISLQSMGRTSDVPQPGIAAYISSMLGVVEVAGLCWVGWEIWTGRGQVDNYGGAILALMLGHQFWDNVYKVQSFSSTTEVL